MGIQTDSINVASILINGVEKLNSSGDLTTNLIQGADNGTGIIVGHAPTGATTGSALQLVSVTTTERDQLVGADGMLIWNETTGQVEGYDAGWAALGGGGGGGTLQDAYDNDAATPVTITTNSTLDHIDITGTAALRVTATGVDNTVNAGFGFDVDTTGAYRIFGDAASTIRVDGSGVDLTLEAAGGGTGQQVIVQSAGTGTAAIRLNASAGGLDIDGTRCDISTSGAFTNAIRFNAVGGGIDIDADFSISIQSDQAGGGAVTIGAPTGSVDVSAGTGTSVLTLGSSGTGTNAIDLNAINGGMTVDAATGFSIDATNASSSNLTCTNTTASTNTTLTVACNNTGATAGDSTINIDANSTNGTATVEIGTTNADALVIGNTTATVLERFTGYQRVTGVVTLTDNVATTILTISLASGESTGGVMRYTVYADDSTDFQAFSRNITWAAVNKGGVYTTNVGTESDSAANVQSAGTLNVTPSIATGTNEIQIQFNANTSLTATTLLVRYVAEEFGSQTLTVA